MTTVSMTNAGIKTTRSTERRLTLGTFDSIELQLLFVRRRFDEIVLIVDSLTGVKTGIAFTDDGGRAAVHAAVLAALGDLAGAENELGELRRDTRSAKQR